MRTRERTGWLAAVLALALGLPWGASAVDNPGKVPSTSASQKSGVRRSDAKATTPSKKPTTKKASAAKARSRRASWRAGQQTPTRERYAEIQQALIQRGYSAGPATGLWGPEWVSALKRFQSEHNLEPSGRLNSLTLIALGLGPKRAAPAETDVARLAEQNSKAEPQ